jgi:ankyrin repeat protein
VQYGKEEAAAVLLEHGAELAARDANGQTAHAWAEHLQDKGIEGGC